MYNFNGRQVSKAKYTQLEKLKKELRLAMDSGMASNYDYSKWPHVTFKNGEKPKKDAVNGNLFPDE